MRITSISDSDRNLIGSAKAPHLIETQTHRRSIDSLRDICDRIFRRLQEKKGSIEYCHAAYSEYLAYLRDAKRAKITPLNHFELLSAF